MSAYGLSQQLGFSMDDKQLKRAGLDYHDLASVVVHPDLDAAWAALASASVNYASAGDGFDENTGRDRRGQAS